MDKTAIEHIQQTAHLPDIIKQAVDAKTQVPVVTLPENMNLTSLERYMENASRYRLGYQTTSIADFVEYNALHDQKGATCFVDADSMSAKSIFDLGTVDQPGHQVNTAKLRLKKTSAFSAICNANGQRMGQKQAGEFIEDWADNLIAFTKEGDIMTQVQAARALQDLTIEAAREVNSRVDDFGESMSAMERIEAKNQALIPAEIQFTCDPYNGLGERKFKLRVGILTGEDKPKVVFRILRLDALEEEIAEEFKDLLVDSSTDLELKTFIGEV
jgi:uncharacterized protein YfdQ (DUF2303 family)